MKTATRYILGVIAIVFMVSSATAQPPKRHEAPAGNERSRYRFARDPFHQAVGEVRRQNADAELIELMFSEKVREHLGMTDEQVAEYRAIMQKPFDGIRKLKEQYKDNPDSLDSLRKDIEKLMSSSSTEAINFLDQNEKLDGLIQIYVQHRKASSASSNQVALRIGLDGEDLEQFRKTKADESRKLMEKLNGEMEQLIRSRDKDRREQMAKLFRYAGQQQAKLLEKELTPEQQAKLNQLAGEPIEGIDRWFMQRPMPGGMGNPSNRRGGDGKDGRKDGGRRGPPNNEKDR